jgi:hypothetical protein
MFAIIIHVIGETWSSQADIRRFSSDWLKNANNRLKNKKH